MEPSKPLQEPEKERNHALARRIQHLIFLARVEEMEYETQVLEY